ncbi:MAG: PAS domain S-box protein, partial [Promethearchaeota archaeon]
FNDLYKTSEGFAIAEYEITKKNGKKLFVESSVYLRYDPNGEIIGFKGFVRDITERKKIEQQLENSKEKYKNLSEELEIIMDSVPALIFYKDTRNNFIRVNKYIADAHRMKKEELEGKSCFELFPEKQAQAYWKDDLDVIKNGKPKLNIDEPWETEEGSRWVLTSKIPYVNDNGEVIGVIGISTDITERKMSEQKLKESEEKYRNLIETSSMGLLEIDMNRGGVIYINPRLLEIIGYTEEELKDEEIFFKAIFPDNLHNIKKLHEEKDIEFNIFNKEGKIIWLSGRTLPSYGEEGNLNTLRLWLQDITEKKEMENMKSNLLTRFSHEFKTPLISIKGFTDFLLTDVRKNLDANTISFLKRIKEGADKLKILIDHFIESTMLNRHLLELNLKRENLSDLINQGIADMEGLIKLRKHTINLDIHSKLIVDIDKDKIYNVFINLLENAIKFTPKEGNITIQSKINKRTVTISIKDNGIGLKKEEYKQLFRPFGKIEKYGKGWDIISDGIGLGLYFSKEIINLHNGKIWAESKGENKGSIFYFSLPFTKNLDNDIEK